jgi:jumonji domain-containing protein 7
MVAQRRPVLIRKGVAGWGAVTRWGPEFFAETVGERTVPIEFYPSGSYYESWLSFETQVSRYLELLRVRPVKERYYMAEVRIDRDLPELWPDIALPPFLDARRLIFTALFFGFDTLSNLHYHATDQALLCQVVGRKTVTMYPPEDFRCLYFHPWYHQRFNFSRIRFDPVDQTRFRNFGLTHGTTCTLEPGDALFIPMHWGHLVHGPGWNASVTFFWKPFLREWRLNRVALHARVGRSFRTFVSRPVAAVCDSVFGFRIIR